MPTNRYEMMAKSALSAANLPHTVKYARPEDESVDAELEFYLLGAKCSLSVQIGAGYFCVNSIENMDTDDFLMTTHYSGSSLVAAMRHAVKQLSRAQS